jgi:hypothetical protein
MRSPLASMNAMVALPNGVLPDGLQCPPAVTQTSPNALRGLEAKPAEAGLVFSVIIIIVLLGRCTDSPSFALLLRLLAGRGLDLLFRGGSNSNLPVVSASIGGHSGESKGGRAPQAAGLKTAIVVEQYFILLQNVL